MGALFRRIIDRSVTWISPILFSHTTKSNKFFTNCVIIMYFQIAHNIFIFIPFRTCLPFIRVVRVHNRRIASQNKNYEKLSVHSRAHSITSILTPSLTISFQSIEYRLVSHDPHLWPAYSVGMKNLRSLTGTSLALTLRQTVFK